MKALTSNGPDMATSLWRYAISATRAFDRERIEFSDSCLIAAQIAFRAARENPLSLRQFAQVTQHTNALNVQATLATQEKLNEFLWDQGEAWWNAWFNTVFQQDGETLPEFAARQADIMEGVANFSERIERIGDEFGFHFRWREYELVHETDGFEMYQVLPLKEGVTVNDALKPVLLVPPYMLGAHILAFLPNEGKSYAHAFANAGIPTYVRVVKDIWENEAVQTMTPEDDCEQTRELCRVLAEKHGQKVTLNGTCQGGYISLMNILSGQYTDVVDTLITNVTPVDGTFSRAIHGMPQLSHDFVTTHLPNGNKVANGYLLSLGMRFVAIDRETPLIKLLEQASLQAATNGNPSKTVAALFRWLRKERVHLPLAIADMSSCTFQQPIAEDGTLPVKLFGKSLNVKELAKLGVKWYQNYAIKDDLVTPACATAANHFLEGTDVIEEVAFFGGHVAILTSPHSKTAPVDGRFTDANGKAVRGPVLFQLEMSPSYNQAAA